MAYIRYNISRINFLNIWETGVWVLNFDDMDDNEELYEELFLESEDLEESQSYRRNPTYKILAGILLLIFLFISLPHVHVLFDGSMDFLKKRVTLQDNEELTTASSAVVWIEAYGEDVLNSPARTGTGFNVSPEGLIISNRHVIEKARSIRIEFQNGQVFYSKNSNIAYVEDADIAWISLEASELPHIVLKPNNSLPAIGDKVSVIGNPRGFKQVILQGPLLGYYPLQEPPVILLDIDCQPGNSGSPVLNAEGEVLGVVFAVTRSEGDESQTNKALAYPLNYFIDNLPLEFNSR
jgi:serine protease Do